MRRAPLQTGVIARYVGNEVDKLRRALPAVLRDGDPEALHEARVGCRRISAALDVLDPILPSKPRKAFEKVLRRVRRQLGPVRDADVMIARAQRWSGRTGDSGGTTWISQSMGERRRRLLARCRRKLDLGRVLQGLGNWWALESELRDADETIKALVSKRLASDWKAYGTGASRVAHADEVIAPPADPHGLRTDGKRLRYRIDLARAAGVRGLDRRARDMKRLHDLLGEWHDWVVFSQTILRQAIRDGLAERDLATYDQVVGVARDAARESRKALRRYAALWNRRKADRSPQDRPEPATAGGEVAPAAITVPAA